MKLNIPDYLNPNFSPDQFGEFSDIAIDLKNKGYAKFKFPDENFNSLAEHIKENLSEIMDLSEVGKEKSPRIQNYLNNSSVKEIACNDLLIKMLSKIYGRKAFPFQTLNFPYGTQQKGHSDNVHFDSIPNNFMAGVWVALEDIHEDSGPLFFYEGSHKWPRVDNFLLGYKQDKNQAPHYHKYTEFWESYADYSKADKKLFLAKKGECLIWSSNLVHGGSKQTDFKRTRWSQVTHYYFEDCSYYTPVFSDEVFNRYCWKEPQNIKTGETIMSSIKPTK